MKFYALRNKIFRCAKAGSVVTALPAIIASVFAVSGILLTRIFFGFFEKFIFSY